MTKDKPFILQYEATTGIGIVGALREKAVAERQLADQYRKSAGPLRALYIEQGRLADNRAKRLEDTADEIHQTIRTALVHDFDVAFNGTGE